MLLNTQKNKYNKDVSALCQLYQEYYLRFWRKPKQQGQVNTSKNLGSVIQSNKKPHNEIISKINTQNIMQQQTLNSPIENQSTSNLNKNNTNLQKHQISFKKQKQTFEQEVIKKNEEQEQIIILDKRKYKIQTKQENIKNDLIQQPHSQQAETKPFNTEENQVNDCFRNQTSLKKANTVEIKETKTQPTSKQEKNQYLNISLDMKQSISNQSQINALKSLYKESQKKAQQTAKENQQLKQAMNEMAKQLEKTKKFMQLINIQLNKQQ